MDTPEHSEIFWVRNPSQADVSPSKKCVVAVETKEYPKINLRVHCDGISSKQRLAIRISSRGLPAFAGDFAKGRLVRHLVFSVASFA